MQMYMSVYWVIIKMYYCRSWSNNHELICFRRRPCVQSTVQVSVVAEEVKATLTKILILRCFLSLDQFGVGG